MGDLTECDAGLTLAREKGKKKTRCKSYRQRGSCTRVWQGCLLVNPQDKVDHRRNPPSPNSGLN